MFYIIKYKMSDINNINDIFIKIDNDIKLYNNLNNSIFLLKNIIHFNYENHNYVDNKYYLPINNKLNNIKVYIIRWVDYTPFHDHSPNGCIFKILHGKLKSNIYINNNIITKIYNKNDIDYIDNNIGLHDMENLFNDFSYSIHIYNKDYHPKYYNLDQDI
jgi:hypothetical protein